MVPGGGDDDLETRMSLSRSSRSTIRLVCLGTLFVESVASGAEPTKEECVAANETGQDLRLLGKFHEALKQFERCIVAACPAPLREDCVTRLAETERAFPK